MISTYLDLLSKSQLRGMQSIPLAFVFTHRGSQTQRAHGLAWPILVALGAMDPGSNPGGPTFLILNNYSTVEKWARMSTAISE